MATASKQNKGTRNKAASQEKAPGRKNTFAKELSQSGSGYDESLRQPPKGFVTMFGIETIQDANYAADLGTFSVEIDLKIQFSSQPAVQLTMKNVFDPDGNLYDAGEHDLSYCWIDSATYSRFRIMTRARRLNYPPVIAYTVSGNVGAG